MANRGRVMKVSARRSRETYPRNDPVVNMIVDSHPTLLAGRSFRLSVDDERSRAISRLPSDASRPILSQSGVDQTVLVQASNSVAESRWLLDLADENSFIAAWLVGLILSEPEIDAVSRVVCASEIQRRRHLVESEPADDWLVQPAVIRFAKAFRAWVCLTICWSIRVTCNTRDCS